MERNKLIINIIPIRPSGGRCIGDMQRPMILLNGKHVIAYTSVSEYADHDEIVVRQTQSIAVGDGIKYVKQPGNSVIDSSMIPENCSWEDFRDPKIWKENGKYYMLVANRKEDGHGQILKYSSDNLREWSYVGVLFSSCERNKKILGKYSFV